MVQNASGFATKMSLDGECTGSNSRTQWLVCSQLSQGGLALPVRIHCAQGIQGREGSLGPPHWATSVPTMSKSPVMNHEWHNLQGGKRLRIGHTAAAPDFWVWGNLRQRATDALFHKLGKQSPEVTTTFAKVTPKMCAGDWNQTGVA